MPVASRKTRRAYDMRAFLKLFVHRKVVIGTTDVSDDVVSFSIPLSSTNKVGGIDLMLNNDDGKYTGTFDIGNDIKVYLDYDGVLDGRDPVFAGKLDTVEYIMDRSGALLLEIPARDYMAWEADRLVFEDFSNNPTPASEVIKFLRDKYASKHSSANTYIETVDTLIDISWNGRPLLACIQDVIEKAENVHFFRCDVNRKWHFGTKGAYKSNIAFVHKGNMTFLNNIDKTVMDLKNRTWIVNDHPETGLPLLHRADSATSQSSYEIHEVLTQNSNLSTISQVISKAINKNAITSSTEQRGSTGSWGLPTLVPGQDVLVIHPYCKANGEKTVVDVTHNFDSGGFFTDVNFEEAEKTMIDKINKREIVEQERLTVNNLFGMTRCHHMEFKDVNYGENGTDPDGDAALESMTKCVVWDDALMMQLLETDGDCESVVHVADADITHMVAKVAGSNFESDEGKTWLRIEVSADGSHYDTIKKDELYVVPENKRGKRLKVRTYFTSLKTKVTGVSILYKCVGH